ncbi:type I secretion protein TolC [Paucibacter sp. KBW04]|uniref:TolC family outer membrane protein n=1 Tax=Paucibacter sp. KBW04 TaxID=2153361 RepID=UPI000F57FFE0|nr:TolC family outer membrane protein [Paucibacter sp. KBW04]RQO63259.1 type I secretion protein TolC [Paucibacter sp. KBW04]
MRKLGFVLALSLAWPQLGAAEDLLQVYARARLSDPVLGQVMAARGVQQEQALQARAGLLPQWKAEATQSRLGSDGSRRSDLASRLSQVLLDLGQLRSWDAAQTLLSAQEARLRAAEQALCARVATAYFGVLTAQASLNTAQANEAAFAEQVRQAQSRFEAGLSAQVDVDQARTYHALAQGSSLESREALADARQALRQVSGESTEGGAAAELAPLAAELKLAAEQAGDEGAQAWVEQALQNNPGLQAFSLGLRAGEQRVAAARAAHLPTLSLGLDSERYSNKPSQIGDINEGRWVNTLALRLSIPLFAGGATESIKRQALYQRDAAREELEAARRALVRETQAQYQARQTSRAQLQSSARAVAAAVQGLAATRAGQALGTRTMTDLLLAIQSQSAAQMAYQQARHRYVLSTLLLQQAAGHLGEAELASVNQLLSPADATVAVNESRNKNEKGAF